MLKNRNFKRCIITGITGSGGSYLADHIRKKNKKIKIYGTTRRKFNQINKPLTNKYKITKLNLKNFNNFYTTNQRKKRKLKILLLI